MCETGTRQSDSGVIAGNLHCWKVNTWLTFGAIVTDFGKKYCLWKYYKADCFDNGKHKYQNQITDVYNQQWQGKVFLTSAKVVFNLNYEQISSLSRKKTYNNLIEISFYYFKNYL